MKVKELIAVLKKLDQDKDIMVPGYEGGFEDVEEVIKTHVVKNVTDNKKHWWLGPHVAAEEHLLSGLNDNKHKEEVYLIPRKS
mgnify:CR=1 FL=1